MESPLSNITITSGIELPDCSTKKPMQELPEGPLTDKNGKQYNLIMATFGDTVRGQGYYLVPHVERLPLFTDLCNNPVFEGDEVWYWYHKHGRIESNTAHIKDLEKHPAFKHRSDCEKWVNSNVKQYTLKGALEMAKSELQFFDSSVAIETFDDIIKEKCL